MRGTLATRVRNRLSRPVRALWPDREVRRVVQGVELVLPWSHRLPDYARVEPAYGQNIVALATALGERLPDREPLVLLDIGANVGDTARQVLNAVDARVLCVEGDPYWLTWLHRNVDSDSRVTVHPGLVWGGDGTPPLAPVRSGGTTRFEPGTAQAAPVVSATQLRAAHPAFASVRLVKSDTDGHDVLLIPALAEAYADQHPVLFFEYDHGLSRLAGHDPVAVWRRLLALGYVEAGVWDNHGTALGRVPLAQMAERAAALDDPRCEADYWDVAVVHARDADALAALAGVLPDDWPGGTSGSATVGGTA